MGFPAEHLLTLLVAIPAAGGLALVWLPDRLAAWARRAALAVALPELAAAAWLSSGLARAGGEIAVRVPWVPRYGLAWHLGADGLSISLVLLTALLVPLSILGPFDGRERARPSYLASLLFLESAVVGVFLARDLVLFYLFWEAMLIPAWFLVGFWGGPARIRAAVRFFVYTVAGSVLMLVGILALAAHHAAVTGAVTFDLRALVSRPAAGHEAWLFGAFFLAFAVKAPLFPFHAWLPGAYREAPTGTSLLLAGVLAKVGVYGFLRVGLPLFPEAASRFAPWALGLALGGFVWGALVALAQEDLKALVAWSSFSHVGLILAGVFSLEPAAHLGAAVQMVSHGLVTAGLFLAAALAADRLGGRGIASLGSLASASPALRGGLVLFSLAALGLPGLSSFIGEFLMVAGLFRRGLLPGFAAVAGVALGTVYVLRMLGRAVMPGEGGGSSPRSPLAPAEGLTLAVLGALVVWIGIFPEGLVGLLRPAVEALLGGGR